jgi:hypothetical protein
MSAPTDPEQWELLLLREALPELVTVWQDHHALPGVLLVFTTAGPHSTGDIFVGWCAQGTPSMQRLLTCVPEPVALRRFITTTPPDLTVVVVIYPQTLRLFRLALPSGDIVLRVCW